MTRCSEHQRLRLRVPDTPRIAAAHALPFLQTPAAIGCDAPHSRAQITTSILSRTATEPKSVTRDRATSLTLHLKIP
jgi:hypothetical protein